MQVVHLAGARTIATGDRAMDSQSSRAAIAKGCLQLWQPAAPGKTSGISCECQSMGIYSNCEDIAHQLWLWPGVVHRPLVSNQLRDSIFREAGRWKAMSARVTFGRHLQPKYGWLRQWPQPMISSSDSLYLACTAYRLHG